MKPTWEYLITAQGAEGVGAPEYVQTASAERAKRAEREYRDAGLTPDRFKRKVWPSGAHSAWKPC